MKKHYLGLRLSVVASIFLLSCEQKEDVVAPQATRTSSIPDDGKTVKLEFAKALAQALKDKEVRDFLKQEALQMYDGDYDVVYALIKNKKLTSGISFEQKLAEYADSSTYNKWLEKEPLMTIFIPNLKGFTPETWDVESQIPDVAVEDFIAAKENNKFIAFSSTLKQYEVDSKKAPEFPIIVVKENERIITKAKHQGKSIAKEASIIEQASTVVIAETDFHSFYFIGDNKPKPPKQVAARNASFNELPYLLVWGARVQPWALDGSTQRDWIYYYIAPNIGYNEGTRAPMYTEYIRGFKLSRPEVLEQISEGWSEGILEFHTYVSFVYRDGTGQTDLKTFFCRREDLMSNGVMKDYNPNIELMPWDAERYGDEWKFSVLEKDAGGSKEMTVASSSKFGANFELSGTIFKKIGAKFGLTGSIEKTRTEKVTINSESDQLGDARLLYENPVIIGTAPNGQYLTYAVGTGSVDISVEPVAKYQDSRPIPD